MPPQKRVAAPMSTDDYSESVEDARSTKRPCRIPVQEHTRDNTRNLAPSPDCIMMNDNAWWLLPQRRNARPARNATTATSLELQCRFCQVALFSTAQSLPPDQQSPLTLWKHNQHSMKHIIDQPSVQRSSVTLLDFYTVQESASAGTNQSTTPRSRTYIMSSTGTKGLTESSNQCSYCDRTDQCRNCTARCDTCGLVFCSFCRTYSAEGIVVCLVCRNNLSSGADDLPNPSASGMEDVMEMG